MAQGSAFGKTILIGDRFVLEEVPAIVSAIPFETICEVERIGGTGWVLEDNRVEVPGCLREQEEGPAARNHQPHPRSDEGRCQEEPPSRSPMAATCWQAAAWAPAPRSAFPWPER